MSLIKLIRRIAKYSNHMENDTAYIHNKKAVLTLDRLRWLSIIEMLYIQFKINPDPLTKEMMKFCGEQSQEIKKQLTTIK
jgi:hypothetical protein